MLYKTVLKSKDTAVRGTITLISFIYIPRMIIWEYSLDFDEICFIQMTLL